MTRWNAFLESLTTPGGKIFLLIAMMLILMSIAMILHMSGHDPQVEGRTLLENSFTALFSIFITYLSVAKGS